MEAIRKAALMVAGALALLLGLGFADPGNSLLMTSFFAKGPLPGIVPKGAVDQGAIIHAITGFNRSLSAAYVDLDATALAAAPMDDALRRNYVEEITFLANDGRALEMTVRDVRIAEVRRLPDLRLSVDTVELVRVRYLKVPGREELVAHPEARYRMNYTLEEIGSGWRIAGVETMKVERPDE